LKIVDLINFLSNGNYMGRFNFNDLRNNLNTIMEPKVENKEIDVYFENIEEKLIDLIDSASYCIGCVSWLTNIKILEKLQEKEGVKIIIQKEPYIKRDFNNDIRHNNYYIRLRRLYKSIPNLFEDIENKRNDLKKKKTFKKLSNAMLSSDQYAIRCCGVVSILYNSKPLMHHKFIIMLNKKFKPIGVWTGSYNFTNNGNYSFENAIYIRDKDIIKKYIDEFLTIYGFSEKISWKYCHFNINKRVF